jgi:hypothetical protein
MNRGNRSPDELPAAMNTPTQTGKKMTVSHRPIASSEAFPRLRALRWMFAAAAIAAVVVPGAADAARRAPGAYDGTWNVVFATTRGNCSSGYSVPFTVTGGHVSSAGGGRVSGSVGRGGSVAVRVSVGASKASGGGRLAGNSGAGGWRGIIRGDRCSGTWQATRN